MIEIEEALREIPVLVTGGAGFIGSAVVQRLAAAGARVMVLDDLSTGRHDAVPPSAEFVEGSVTDAPLVTRLVAMNRLVIHLAARNIIASTKDPRDDFATNIGGTLNVLMAAREAGIERVVYGSTTSVYGNPRNIPINEDDLITPLSPYAVSKLAGENYCFAFHESYGLPMAVVRYANVYGPGEHPDNPYASVVTKFFSSAFAGETLLIHGDGLQTRDFVFVDDTVEATLSCAVHPKAIGEVFNVGTSMETSVVDLARMIGQAAGRDVVLGSIDRRDIDNIRRCVVNTEKARRMLRWTPSVRIETGLARTAAWFGAEGLADQSGSVPMIS